MFNPHNIIQAVRRSTSLVTRTHLVQRTRWNAHRVMAPVAVQSLSQIPFSTHSHHSEKPSILVVGGSGALGSGMIQTFKKAGWKTICIDFKANSASDHNITLLRESTWKGNLTLAEESLRDMFEQKVKTIHPPSVVVHCAGSWLGGGITDGSFLESVDPMLEINLKSGISAAYLAGQFLSQRGDGLFVLTGAAAAGNGTLSPTAGMLSYGMSKAATHQLAISLSQKEGGLKNATVVCVLPTMIDTPSNRAMASSSEDYVNWTPPSEFAELTLSFAQQLASATGATSKAATGATKSSTPVIEHARVQLKHGAFYHFETLKGKTTIKLLP